MTVAGPHIGVLPSLRALPFTHRSPKKTFTSRDTWTSMTSLAGRPVGVGRSSEHTGTAHGTSQSPALLTSSHSVSVSTAGVNRPGTERVHLGPGGVGGRGRQSVRGQTGPLARGWYGSHVTGEPRWSLTNPAVWCTPRGREAAGAGPAGTAWSGRKDRCSGGSDVWSALPPPRLRYGTGKVTRTAGSGRPVREPTGVQ